MEDFSLWQTLADYGIGAIFGGVILYISRRDHADMLRREQQFSASLEGIIAKYIALSERTTEANTRLERQIHDLKNTIQRFTQSVDRLAIEMTGRPLSPGGAASDD